jgi:hypothetical protein
MSVLLVSLVAVALVSLIGALIVRAIAAIPLTVLAQAEEGGRYAGLGARDETSAATPPAGRPVATLVPAKGYGY